MVCSKKLCFQARNCPIFAWAMVAPFCGFFRYCRSMTEFCFPTSSFSLFRLTTRRKLFSVNAARWCCLTTADPLLFFFACAFFLSFFSALVRRLTCLSLLFFCFSLFSWQTDRRAPAPLQWSVDVLYAVATRRGRSRPCAQRQAQWSLDQRRGS